MVGPPLLVETMGTVEKSSAIQMPCCPKDNNFQDCLIRISLTEICQIFISLILRP